MEDQYISGIRQPFDKPRMPHDPITGKFFPFEEGLGDGSEKGVIRAIIVAIDDDYLSCAYDTTRITVSKPYDLRKSTYDGKTITYPDINVSYEANSDGTRTATDADDSDNVWIEELSQEYYVDETIFVSFISNGQSYDYVDLNVSGRHWLNSHSLYIYKTTADPSGGTVTAKRVDSNGDVTGSEFTFVVFEEE